MYRSAKMREELKKSDRNLSQSRSDFGKLSKFNTANYIITDSANAFPVIYSCAQILVI